MFVSSACQSIPSCNGRCSWQTYNSIKCLCETPSNSWHCCLPRQQLTACQPQTITQSPIGNGFRLSRAHWCVIDGGDESTHLHSIGELVRLIAGFVSLFHVREWLKPTPEDVAIFKHTLRWEFSQVTFIFSSHYFSTNPYAFCCMRRQYWLT